MNTEKISQFVSTESNKAKLIVIYWPTASGKTSLSIETAKMLNSEVISTDSRQIFRGMDIGTGKVTEEEMQGIKHHMIDIIEPDQNFSVSEFKSQAEGYIATLHEVGKIPILAWGTGLYIDSIIYDFKVEGTSSNSELRSELEKLSSEVLHKKLEAIDPEYAAELHKNNRQYVVRALEYHAVTWKSKREDREEKKLQYDVLFLSPDYGTREDLYKRINTRVGQMFEEWLEAEVNWLINHWYGEDSFGMKSIGYSEFFPYIRWEYDLDHCKELVQQHSRNYAKRQLTWFKKYEQHF